MAEILERIEDHFSTRAFLLGLCVVLGLYLVVLGILAAIEQKTLQELDARLANQSVVIDHIQTGQPEIAPTPVAGLPAKPKEVAEAVSSTSVADDIAALTHANRRRHFACCASHRQHTLQRIPQTVCIEPR